MEEGWPASAKGNEGLVKGNSTVMKGRKGVRRGTCRGQGLGFRVSKELAAEMMSTKRESKAE